MRPLTKVLIANRGEIAVRIIRALREEGVRAVAVFSDVDRESLHVRLADEAYLIGGARPRESYLSIEKLVRVATESGCDAVHPGYGFLAENPEFVEAVEAAGMIFVGPTAATMRLLGDKVAARWEAEAAGVPVVPGGADPIKSHADLRTRADAVGYPLILKAAAGGGGKGIRVVRQESELVAAFDRASSEAQTAFGNSAIYVERFLQNTRHIEVQLLGDGRGNVVHLGERECSLQRRHQKLVEEAPSPVLHPAVRDRITAAACALAARIEYRGAGTAEFLVENAHDADQAQFFFMEVNTRLQVEHPVTEAVFGVDLVRDQLRIARGGPLGYEQADLVPRGHAIETRIYAEDPERGFVPSTGQIGAAELPMGPGTRVDTALFAGDRVSVYYDPLIGKLTVWGRTRAEAVTRLERALSEMRITGVKTTIPLLRHVARAEAFRRADFHIHWLEPFAKRELATPPTARRWKRAAVAAAVQAAERARRGSVAAAAVGAGTEGPGHLSPWTLAGRSAQLGGGA